VADSGNHAIRKVDIVSGYMSTLAGSGTAGYNDAVGVLAQFNKPTAGYPLGLDVFGPKLYIAFESDHQIQQADWTTPTPTLSVLAGDGTNGLVDNVNGAAAKFYNPTGVAVDFAGQSLLVADSRDHTIRIIDLSSTAVSTLVGTGVAGGEDSIDPNSATLSLPFGVSVTRDGRWGLVSDQGNSGIRR
ncbi:hypothetical protein GUITHDRAFT_58597, partial [Guillardia theta CCMP2712]